jgi:hypothetical protein
MIATTKGFVVFVGRENEERKPGDLLLASNPHYPPVRPLGDAR